MKKVVFAVFVLALLCLPVIAAQAEMKSKMNVDFYGYVKLDAFYEHGYAIQDNFLLYSPPSNTCGLYGGCVKDEIRNGDRDSLGMTARQTRFGFVITGPESEGGLITRARIEADFYGTGVTRLASANQDAEEEKGLMMLRRATVEIVGKNWELLAGNEWMVVSPLAPMTNDYTALADAGNLGYRMPQIRLTTYALDKKLIFQVAAVNKMGDVEALDIDTGRMSAMPAWEGGITYKDKFTFGITGHYGMEEVRTYRYDVVSSKQVLGNHGAMIDSWSGNVHAVIPLGEVASISGEWYMGANLDGMYTGGQGDGWVVTEDGKREALEDTGGWVQLMVTPAKPIKIYAAFGIDDVNDDQLKNGIIEPGYASKAGNSAITKNYFYSVMVDYYVNPATKISCEWMQVITDYSLADNGAADPLATGWVPKTGDARWDTGKVDRWSLSFWYMF